MAINISTLIKKQVISSNDVLHLISQDFVDYQSPVSGIMKASDRHYDGTTSGLFSDNMQDAVVEFGGAGVTNPNSYYKEVESLTLLVGVGGYTAGTSDIDINHPVSQEFDTVQEALDEASRLVSKDVLNPRPFAGRAGSNVLVSIFINNNYSNTTVENVVLVGGDYRHVRITSRAPTNSNYDISLSGFCRGPAIAGDVNYVTLSDGSSVTFVDEYTTGQFGPASSVSIGSLSASSCSEVAVSCHTKSEAGLNLYDVVQGSDRRPILNFGASPPDQVTGDGIIKVSKCSTLFCHSEENFSTKPIYVSGNQATLGDFSEELVSVKVLDCSDLFIGLNNGDDWIMDMSNCSTLSPHYKPLNNGPNRSQFYAEARMSGCCSFERILPTYTQFGLNTMSGTLLMNGCSDTYEVGNLSRSYTGLQANSCSMYTGESGDISTSQAIPRVDLSGSSFFMLTSQTQLTVNGSYGSTNVNKASKMLTFQNLGNTGAANITPNQYVDQGVILDNIQ